VTGNKGSGGYANYRLQTVVERDRDNSKVQLQQWDRYRVAKNVLR